MAKKSPLQNIIKTNDEQNKIEQQKKLELLKANQGDLVDFDDKKGIHVPREIILPKEPAKEIQKEINYLNSLDWVDKSKYPSIEQTNESISVADITEKDFISVLDNTSDNSLLNKLANDFSKQEHDKSNKSQISIYIDDDISKKVDFIVFQMKQNNMAKINKTSFINFCLNEVIKKYKL